MKKLVAITGSLLILAGCARDSPYQTNQNRPLTPYTNIDGLLDSLGDSVICRDLPIEEQRLIRAGIPPQKGYESAYTAARKTSVKLKTFK